MAASSIGGRYDVDRWVTALRRAHGVEMFGGARRPDCLVTGVDGGMNHQRKGSVWMALNDSWTVPLGAWLGPCYTEGMSTYVVTQDGARFEVRRGDASGPVVATFSNKLAAETFAEKQRVKDQDTVQPPPNRNGLA